MKNWQINNHLEEFDRLRQEWINILVKNPGHSDACHHILSINAKMEVYRSMWNWHDETVEMAVVR